MNPKIEKTIAELFWLIKDSGLPSDKGQALVDKLAELEDAIEEAAP